MIAFKVLAGNHHTKTPAEVADAIKFAFDHIKPTGVALLGMWQKHKDQPGENCRLTRKILAAGYLLQFLTQIAIAPLRDCE